MPDNILVTGFGPFGEHKINASWEAVKLLPDLVEDFNIVKQQVPVTYDYVENNIAGLWQKFKPKLVVHVGVSSFTNKITIETRAHRSGYLKTDCSGAVHTTGQACCSTKGEDCITADIDVKDICEYLNNRTSFQAKESEDAGRYLCEFIFYTSLNIDKTKSLFIHVPPLNKPYTAEELAESLLQIIKCALKQNHCACSS